MKARFILFILSLVIFNALALGQGNIVPCSQCGKRVCNTKNNHPKCSDCEKLIGVKENPCSDNGKHPKCVCGKLIESGYKNSCTFGGKHTVCEICKKSVGIPNGMSCQYDGNHRYKVVFECNVSNARICIDDSLTCTSNGSCVLRHGRHTLTISADNYKSKHTTIEVDQPGITYPFSLSELPPNGYKKTISVNGVEFKMVYVHGGTFTMGTSDFEIDEALLATQNEPSWHQGVTRETPHNVELSNYYIGETEVTEELWDVITEVLFFEKQGFHSAGIVDECKQLPHNRVSWNSGQEFINILNSLTGLNFRMPTEAEWEYAARGGKNGNPTLFSGSNNLSIVGWYEGNKYTEKEKKKYWRNRMGVHPVKTKMANELGLRNMTGNVAEWCSDWHAKYTNKNEFNPIGPRNGQYKVYRGGSWADPIMNCFVFSRGSTGPDIASDEIGLRLVLPDQDF